MSGASADYDYEVPPQAVAQEPPERRDGARLLRVARQGEPVVRGEGAIPDLVDELRAGDLLVLNEARVLPGRLHARRLQTGGRVQLLVLRVAGRRARALVGARGTLRPGELFDVDGDRWRLRAALGEGRWELEVEPGGRDVETLLAAVGRMPLPPYIERAEGGDPRDALDRERYQTTYARAGGASQLGAATAAAAPTAGLHLTPELLARIEARGVRCVRLRLDVGEGTFRPLRGERLDEHVMHAERFEIPDEVGRAYAETRAAGGRVVAVGTTVVRALESAVAADGRSLALGEAETALFIRPGHAFRAVDALLTNFHQPRSTLLVLVSAFAGRQRIAAAYARAIASGFRLFSYGDAMFIA